MSIVRARLAGCDLWVTNLEGQAPPERPESYIRDTGVADRKQQALEAVAVRGREACDTAEELVTAIATGIAGRMQEIPPEKRPSQFEAELTLGFSGEVKAWVVTAKGEGVLKVKMLWGGRNDDGQSARRKRVED